MATICAKQVVENALFFLFEGLAGAHFRFFISESPPLGLEMLFKPF